MYFLRILAVVLTAAAFVSPPAMANDWQPNHDKHGNHGGKKPVIKTAANANANAEAKAVAHGGKGGTGIGYGGNVVNKPVIKTEVTAKGGKGGTGIGYGGKGGNGYGGQGGAGGKGGQGGAGGNAQQHQTATANNNGVNNSTVLNIEGAEAAAYAADVVANGNTAPCVKQNGITLGTVGATGGLVISSESGNCWGERRANQLAVLLGDGWAGAIYLAQTDPAACHTLAARYPSEFTCVPRKTRGGNPLHQARMPQPNIVAAPAPVKVAAADGDYSIGNGVHCRVRGGQLVGVAKGELSNSAATANCHTAGY